MQKIIASYNVATGKTYENFVYPPANYYPEHELNQQNYYIERCREYEQRKEQFKHSSITNTNTNTNIPAPTNIPIPAITISTNNVITVPPRPQTRRANNPGTLDIHKLPFM